LNKFLSVLVICAGLTLTACGTANIGGAPAAQEAKSTKVAMTVAAMDSSTTTGSGVTAAAITAIADNFNTADGLATNDWVTPQSPDTGNFRMICGAGQLSYDDPIVYPGQPGKSHLHQFYGNLGADANSTYESLRTTGRSTCGDPSSDAPVNRSGYWMPAMLDGAGNVVRPEYVAIYYKRAPANAPECTPGNAAFIGKCVGIPTGLRYITGYNMQAANMGDAHPFFYCQDSDLGGAKAVSGALQNDIPSVIPLCPVGARLTLNIGGPDCWDGVNLDTPDHRSHMAHGAYVWDATTNQSHYRCDTAHPYHIPQMTLMAFYVTDGNFQAGKWHLSSDEMMPSAPAGSTFHADYWEAWSPTVRQTWEQYCTNGGLQCAGGDLGNGTRIKGMLVPNTSGLVALNSISTGTTITSTTSPTSTTSSTGVPIVTSPTVVTSPTGGAGSTCKGKGKKCVG
jgi:hypothetical protein